MSHVTSRGATTGRGVVALTFALLLVLSGLGVSPAVVAPALADGDSARGYC